MKQPRGDTRDADLAIGTAAEKEAAAQLEIVRVLKPMYREDRERILQAIMHLLEADARVPGVLEAFLLGQARRTSPPKGGGE